MELFTLGIDLGKTTFHLVGMNQGGEVVLRKQYGKLPKRDFWGTLECP
jgi:activator of 2-hydroxyglutaryl-CoA dehydratase